MLLIFYHKTDTGFWKSTLENSLDSILVRFYYTYPYELSAWNCVHKKSILRVNGLMLWNLYMTTEIALTVK